MLTVAKWKSTEKNPSISRTSAGMLGCVLESASRSGRHKYTVHTNKSTIVY